MSSTLHDDVAVLVATSERTELLETRALPSIARQTRAPACAVVVDDSGDAGAKRTEALVQGWRPAGVDVAYLRNRRSTGAAGAWNSGLDHLLRICADPERLFVAILDDDDEWMPAHLQRCLAAAERRRLDVVASGFWRIEEGAEPKLVTPPESLEVARFLVGNPGIQGSKSGVPAQRVAGSGNIRRVAAELHGPRLVHPHRRLAGRPLRRGCRADRSPLRLRVPAAVVHAGIACEERGVGRVLPQVALAHVWRGTWGVLRSS